MTEDKNGSQSIERKLNVIVALLLRIANNGNPVTAKDQIKDLSSLGMTSAEIASVLAKETQYVSQELSKIKAAKKK